jgi:Transposase DDE domain.
MIIYSKITEIFCLVDEFCKEYDQIVDKHLLGTPSKRPSVMTKSEVITITILFQLSGFRTFKHFYIYYLQKHMQDDFPNTVSYNRFTELMQQNLMAMTLFLKTCCLGNCTGISFVDSTPIRVCKSKRIKNNKVFKGIATTGKSTMGWFHGFKLHIIINDKGEILNFTITQANIDDRAPLKKKSFLDKIYGKLYADKGYIGKDLMQLLFADGLHLITHIKNNMKNSLMTMSDKILLRKRSVIETVNDELKNICQVEHSRHRSFTNFLSNIVAGLIAYSFLPKKPTIKYQTVKSNQLTLY